MTTRRRPTSPVVCGAAAILLLAPATLTGQAGERRPPPATAVVGAFAALGSGPIDAGALGLSVALPIWWRVAATGEVSGWGNGLGGTTCIAAIPESYRCSVSGWAALAGLELAVPLAGRTALFGEVAGGRFSRGGFGGGEPVVSAALSFQAGVGIRVHGPWRVRGGGRVLRVLDDDYRARLGDDLAYAMAMLGLAYGIPLP